MLRKFIRTGIAFLTVTLLLSLVASPMAMASGDGLIDDVDKTNSSIDKMIREAIKDADRALKDCRNHIDDELEKLNKDLGKLGEVNGNIEKHVASLERKLDRIAGELIDKSNGKAYGLIKKAAKYGVVVICEYVEVKLGDRTYLIDPLRIVGN